MTDTTAGEYRTLHNTLQHWHLWLWNYLQHAPGDHLIETPRHHLREIDQALHDAAVALLPLAAPPVWHPDPDLMNTRRT